tara:strand:- start:1794 stop:2489 length:696 start_codon:yes stop_codon:yes gene_type:complete
MNKMKELTLVIPAKEEEDSLPLVLNEIKNLELNIIVVLAEDDLKTINVLKNFDCEVLYQSKRGYGNAIIEGIKKVQTKYIAIFYADGSTDPKFLVPMLEKITKEKNQIVFGSRYEKNAKSYDDDIITRIGNYGFTLMGNLLFSLKITDILFTYIVAEREIMEKMDLKSNDYCLCVEIPVKTKKMNFNYATHPCIERKRFAGKKKVKAFKNGLEILFSLIKNFFNSNSFDGK